MPYALLSLLLASHICLISYNAIVHSPTIDEVAHLPAGLMIWGRNDYRLYPVNPPLVKMIASVPHTIAFVI